MVDHEVAALQGFLDHAVGLVDNFHQLDRTALLAHPALFSMMNGLHGDSFAGWGGDSILAAARVTCWFHPVPPGSMQRREQSPMGLQSVLIVGGDSRLGRALAAAFREAGNVELFRTSRRPERSPGVFFLDLAAPAESWQLPPRSDVAYLLASVVGPQDFAERPALARQANVVATRDLAQRLLAMGTRVIFISTSLVFDGRMAFAKASSERRPLNFYAALKAEAEDRLLALGEGVSILRLAKVVPPDDALFGTWLDRLRRGDPIEPIEAALMSPVTLDLAVETMICIGRSAKVAGFYQLSARNEVSYVELAGLLAEAIAADPTLIRPSRGDPTRWTIAGRPRHATLDSTRIRRAFGIIPPASRSALDYVLEWREIPAAR